MTNLRRHSNMQSGFTIVELVIVIVVISILTTLVVTAYSSIQRRALDSSMQTDAGNWYNLMYNSYTINGFYDLNATSSTSPYKTSGTNIYTPSSSGSGANIIFTATITNPSTSDAYIVSVGGISNNNVPLLVTNPYITSPLTGATNDSGWCGPATAESVYLTSSGGGTPVPTIQWQYLSPKNANTGTWTNVPGGTTANYNYSNSSGALTYGDYQLYRVLYKSSSNTTTSASLTINITNGC
jgi:prepilin-type N-terminal cleavage/methylation domain-containing protein